MKKKTTAIRVLDKTWHVPRGFGRVYMRAVKDEIARIAAGKPGEAIATIIGLLALVGYAATAEQVLDWDLRRRVEAVIYAATEHARASDNPVQRHPRPSWLPERAWQGPERRQGAFSGPTGTPIVERAS